ncbi:MAG TPA: ATP-binding cassette domain-containing protein [Terriglobia bacterium]|nr:ATP-binding cassette domain-containing protein [Terriglobia bacterium]
MSVGIRIQDLRKVYHTPPPMAARGAPLLPVGGRSRDKKKFEVVALDGVSLEVQPGEIFGLLGPNGAGKSTTVGILTTRSRPTSGQAWVGEYDVWNSRQQLAVKRLIGVVAQRPNLDYSLTAREILLFHGAYFGLGSAVCLKRAQELIEQFKLTEHADRMPLGFSGGLMQRLSIARAMMHDPEVLFLDEPSAGLDPQTRLLLWELVREYNRRGKTILLTTHNMEEADEVCHRIAIIDHGRIIALGNPKELKTSIAGAYLLRLRFSCTSPEFLRSLESLPGVREVRGADGGTDVYADRGGALIPEIVNMAAASQVEIHDVNISEPSLENFFLHHTGRSLRE